MSSIRERATARPIANMSRQRRLPCALAARLGAWATSTTTRSNRAGTSALAAEGRSTKTVKECGVACSARAATSWRANRPNPRRLDRQLPSIPIFIGGLGNAPVMLPEFAAISSPTETATRASAAAPPQAKSQPPAGPRVRAGRAGRARPASGAPAKDKWRSLPKSRNCSNTPTVKPGRRRQRVLPRAGART